MSYLGARADAWNPPGWSAWFWHSSAVGNDRNGNEESMNEDVTAGDGRRWDPQPGDGDRIWSHLLRQRGLDRHHVRLDDGRVVRVGADAEGEAE